MVVVLSLAGSALGPRAAVPTPSRERTSRNVDYATRLGVRAVPGTAFAGRRKFVGSI